MEKQMNVLFVYLYKFSSRGLLWPVLFGSVFGLNVLPFNNLINSCIGILIGCLLSLPFAELYSASAFCILLLIASFVGNGPYGALWSGLAPALLCIHIIRIAIRQVLGHKFPKQTVEMDSDYQDARRWRW